MTTKHQVKRKNEQKKKHVYIFPRGSLLMCQNQTNKSTFFASSMSSSSASKINLTLKNSESMETKNCNERQNKKAHNKIIIIPIEWDL